MDIKGDSDKLMASITKYSFSDSIPEVDDFPNARGHVHHSFPSDVSVK